jgi:hypothetical protein
MMDVAAALQIALKLEGSQRTHLGERGELYDSRNDQRSR